MKRKIVLFTLLVFSIAILIFVASNMENQEVITVKDYLRLENKQKTRTVLGRLTNISLDSLTISDFEFPEDEIIYTFEKNELFLNNYALGDTVLVEGFYDKELSILKSSKTEKIEADKVTFYINKRRPLIEISVIKYPGVIPNTSQESSFKIVLKNIGKVPINHKDLYDNEFGYFFIYRLNDTFYSFQNIDNFGIIEPGETKEITVPIVAETSANSNTITFVWARKSVYDEDYTVLSESEAIEIVFEDDMNI
jgi:hypothetical protein